MTECAVRRLHVAAASEPAARRFVTTLEDALRCATLPGDDRRVVVVRRLALGRVAHDAGTQRLGLLIEQRLARGDIVWADVEAAPDPRADLIGFTGALQARVHLARRLVRGLPCDAWYWPLAIAEYRRDLPPRDALRRVAHTLSAWPEARVALPEWIAEVAHAGGMEMLCASIDEARGRALLRAAGIPLPVAAPASMRVPPPPANAALTMPPRADADSGPGTGEAMPAATSTWPTWLRVALARARGEVARGDAQGMLASARAAARATPHVPAVAAECASEPRSGGMREPEARPAAAPSSARSTTTTSPDAPEQDPSTARAEAMAGSAQPRPVSRPRQALASERDWQATDCGGLLFLLPVLARARLVQRESPDADRMATLQVLRAALVRVHATPEDAAWALVDELSPLSPAPARAAEERARRELAMARRWLHRHARLGLVALVRRPARLALTATHIDVRFALSSADVRVRRLGLDMDPGWVPWFGRVIAFQFIGRQP